MMSQRADSAANLRHRAILARHYGILTVRLCEHHMTPGEDVQAVLNTFVVSQGFLSIDENWETLSSERAHRLLECILCQHLALRLPLMTEAKAEPFISEFKGYFGPDVLWFTNGDEIALNEPRTSSSWSPVTGFTFDRGIVGVDAHTVGMFWASDED